GPAGCSRVEPKGALKGLGSVAHLLAPALVAGILLVAASPERSWIVAVYDGGDDPAFSVEICGVPGGPPSLAVRPPAAPPPWPQDPTDDARAGCASILRVRPPPPR